MTKNPQSPAYFLRLWEDDLHMIAQERHGRRLRPGELRDAVNGFKNCLDWCGPAEIVIELAIGDTLAREQQPPGTALSPTD